MRILLVPDKFKGSLTAKQVISGLEEGIRAVLPQAEIDAVIASDGGDGFLQAIAAMRSVREVQVPVQDPLGRPISASYLLEDNERNAYIELAAASGLVLLAKDELAPLHTSTYGTGLQIRHAIDSGAETIYLGLGGSATNDGGTGIGRALGYRFLDKSGKELFANGGNLSDIRNIVPPTLPFQARIIAVNDVNNPLLGPQGAARVYAPQKGAGPDEVELLEAGLEHLAGLVKDQLGKDISQTPGAGAAGGAAFGLKAFLDASFTSGASFVYNLTGLDEKLKNADLLITGEGRIDQQTLHGKLIQELVHKAKEHELEIWAVCGISEVSQDELQAEGIDRLIEIADPRQSLSKNMEQAYPMLVKAIAEQCREAFTPR